MLIVGPKAERDWAELDATWVPRFQRILKLIAERYDGLRWKRMGDEGRFGERFGHREVWSVRVARQVRLFTDSRIHLQANGGPPEEITILGLARRNEKRFFRSQS